MLLNCCLALVILTTILFLHYRTHFQCGITRIRNIKCIHCFKSVDNEQFNFFPMSYLAYITFSILLILIIIVRRTFSNYQNISDLLFSFPVNFSILSTYNTIDYLILYGVMILLLWGSLLSFHRYWCAVLSTKLESVTTKDVLKAFWIYPVVFITLYLIQIYLLYWIFPLIILTHSIFNIYCNIKFATILIARYSILSDIVDSIDCRNAIQDDINSIQFIKLNSFICCWVETSCLLSFIVYYSQITLCLFPIIWSVNCFLSGLNFARNRNTFKRCLIFCTRRANKPTQEKKVKLHIDITSTGDLNPNNKPININKPIDIAVPINTNSPTSTKNQSEYMLGIINASIHPTKKINDTNDTPMLSDRHYSQPVLYHSEDRGTPPSISKFQSAPSPVGVAQQFAQERRIGIFKPQIGNKFSDENVFVYTDYETYGKENECVTTDKDLNTNVSDIEKQTPTVNCNDGISRNSIPRLPTLTENSTSSGIKSWEVLAKYGFCSTRTMHEIMRHTSQRSSDTHLQIVELERANTHKVISSNQLHITPMKRGDSVR